jgi:RNA polymerase sigma factor (sigma-70 family)
LTSIETDIHKQIISDCIGGSRKAQYKLYSLYAKAMFNICLRMLNKRELAEDILQDSFTDAFRKLETFRFNSTFGAWLKQIVVNKCINELKKKNTATEFIEEIGNYDLVDYSENSEEKEVELAFEIENVRRAMQLLPDGSRSIFSLYLFEGYDHVEIAEIMKISESTSKSQYMRAKQKVKEILISQGYGKR